MKKENKIRKNNSYTKIPNKILNNKDLDTTGALVYIAILSRARKGEATSTSLKTIARDAMCSRGTVIRKIKKLEALNLVSVKRYARNSKKRNLYTIN
jgi:DNA-binding MarR family transcriptional regulator